MTIEVVAEKSGPKQSISLSKELSDVLADPLVQLFRKSLASGHVPNDSKQANVTPVFKKGRLPSHKLNMYSKQTDGTYHL